MSLGAEQFFRTNLTLFGESSSMLRRNGKPRLVNSTVRYPRVANRDAQVVRTMSHIENQVRPCHAHMLKVPDSWDDRTLLLPS